MCPEGVSGGRPAGGGWATAGALATARRLPGSRRLNNGGRPGNGGRPAGAQRRTVDSDRPAVFARGRLADFLLQAARNVRFAIDRRHS